MEHVIIFVCIQMQLQTLLCCTCNMIFITTFLKLNKNFLTPPFHPPPPPPQGKVLGAHLGFTVTE
jgi:hypothetical protein